MTHCDVAISAHYAQQNGASKLINTGGNHIGFTRIVPKHPMPMKNGGYEKWYSNQKKLVRNGQIYDIHIGDCLHFGVAHHYVNDKGVPSYSHQTNQGEKNGLGDLDEVEGMNVLIAHVGGDVHVVHLGGFLQS